MTSIPDELRNPEEMERLRNIIVPFIRSKDSDPRLLMLFHEASAINNLESLQTMAELVSIYPEISDIGKILEKHEFRENSVEQKLHKLYAQLLKIVFEHKKDKYPKKEKKDEDEA